MKILIAAIIILIILIIIGVVIFLVTGQEKEKKNRRMALIQGKSQTRSPKEDAKDLQNKRRAEIAKKLKDSKNGGNQQDDKKRKATIALLIAQAGMNISVRQYWIGAGLSMVACVFLAKIMGASTFVMLMAAIIGLLGLPRFILKRNAGKRQKKFLEEFPDALEATVRLLKAGMPVSEAIAMIAKEYDGPVGEEMRIIYDKQKIGIPLYEAAYEATQRMPLPEMQMFATGLAIQAQTGSSLSEILLNLSGVIRARFRLKRKVKALSSEAISSAGIIGALPVMVSGGMYFLNPAYLNVLITDPFGNVLLGGAVLWMGVGIVVMKIMINFKV